MSTKAAWHERPEHAVSGPESGLGHKPPGHHVHLEDAVGTAKPGETELHLDRTGAVPRAADA